MVYLLILLGLAVVVAPLMSAMPSKTQRAKAGLRDLARAHDLRVSLRPLPAVPARFRFEPEDELACYERRFPVSQQKSGGEAHYLCVDGQWSPTTGVEEAPGGCNTCLLVRPTSSAEMKASAFSGMKKRAPRGWLKSAKPLI